MTTFTARFDSITELGNALATIEANKTRQRGADSLSQHGMDYGDFSMQQAIDCAINGGNWAEGAANMPTVNIEHKTLHGASIDAPVIESAMVGFAPNVPAYLANEPDSMFCQELQPAEDKLLRVAVHVGRVGGSAQHQAFNRGAAIMAVLDQLSREGYSIELWAIWRNTASGTTASIETCIKHGTDYWSPESVAFALAHIAFQRRLCWRLAEATEGMSRVTETTYGNGTSADFSDFDLSYGYVHTPCHFNGLEQSIDRIKQETIKQLEARV